MTGEGSPGNFREGLGAREFSGIRVKPMIDEGREVRALASKTTTKTLANKMENRRSGRPRDVLISVSELEFLSTCNQYRRFLFDAQVATRADLPAPTGKSGGRSFAATCPRAPSRSPLSLRLDMGDTGQ